MPDPNITIEWDNGLNVATGFTSIDQTERFIRRVGKKAAPDKECRVITHYPLYDPPQKPKQKAKLESWQNCETRQH